MLFDAYLFYQLISDITDFDLSTGMTDAAKAGLVIIGLVVMIFAMFLSYYLTYMILKQIHATDLMWFIYWILIPIAFVSAIISKVIDWTKQY